MPIIDGCCCFAQLKQGSRASGVFSLVTSIINIIINLWLLVHIHRLGNSLEHNQVLVFLPPAILVFLYIELAFNLALMALSFLLMIGVEQGYEGRKFIKPWLLGVCCFRGYEVLLGIYVVAWLGGHRIDDLLFIFPEFIVVIAYWTIDCILLVAAVICVISYTQEMSGEIFTKQKLKTSYNRRYKPIAAAGMSRAAMSRAASNYSLAQSTRSLTGVGKY